MSPTRATLALGLLWLAACTRAPEPPATGPWHAWLDSPGGALPFELELLEQNGGLRAFAQNGDERIELTRVVRSGRTLTIDIEHYDSRITAELSADGRRLDGAWEKTGVAGAPTRMEFHAIAGDRERFASGPAGIDAGAASRIEGRWAVEFAEDDQPAIGVFRAGAGGSVVGTFMTTTGDYRYLGGQFDGQRLRLSVFDGAHAFLFDARMGPGGTLAGDFWSRDSWHETWTARRDPEATLPDAFELTRWVGGRELDELAYPDLTGRPRSLDDPAFAGKARIVEVFGSWCPNCNDATAHLVRLHREYRDRGLSVVGLAFEMTGDFERDAAQVRIFAEHHGIEFPLLIAGTAVKSEASESFPLLDRIRSFPTTIFLHADGRVRAVHQGYSGPATGRAHEALKQRFRELIEELLRDS